MQSDFFEPIHQRGDVIMMTNVSAASLHNWLTRPYGKGGLKLDPRQKGGTGNRRLFSGFDIVKIDVTQNLLPLGIGPTTVNSIIASDRFKEWVRLCLGPAGEKPLYRLIVITKTEAGLLVDYLATRDMTQVWEREFEDLLGAPKAHVVLRLGDIVDRVRQRIRALEIERKPDEQRTDAERAILSMRRAAETRRSESLRKIEEWAAESREGK